MKQAEKNTWDKTWNKSRGKVSVISLDRLVFKKIHELVDYKDKDIVELGCGRGVLCYLMLKTGARSCTLVDFSVSALNLSRMLFDPTDNVEFINSDIFNLSDKKKYDVVFSFGVAEHFSDKLREDVIYQHCKLTRDIAVLIVPAMPHYNTVRQRKKRVMNLYGWQYAFSKNEMLDIVKKFDGYDIIVNKRFYPLYGINLFEFFALDDKFALSNIWNPALYHFDSILQKIGFYKLFDILLSPFANQLGGLLITVIKKK